MVSGGVRGLVKDGERENGRGVIGVRQKMVGGVKNIGRDNAGGGQRWQQRKLGGVVEDSTEKLDQIIVKINLNILSLFKNGHLLAIAHEWKL